MGDRANVKVIDGKSAVFLYSHWGGSELPATLQTALKRRKRWDDGQYLARIIFDAMVGEHQGGETGFGISSVVGDGDGRILEVDVDLQEVRRGEVRWPFAEYVELPSKALDAVWGES